MIGFGAQGKVYAATLSPDNSPNSSSEIASTSVNEIQHSTRKVALKLYNTEDCAEIARMAEEEFRVLSCIQGHPNIVKIFDFKRNCGHLQVPNSLPKSPDDHFCQYRQGSTSVKDATYLTMELSSFGDLYDVVKSSGGFKNC